MTELRSPKRATLRRWRRQAGLKYSIYRGLEYELIEGVELAGISVDIGGGARAGYLPLLQAHGPVFGVNIDVGIRPSVLADLNEGVPLRTGSVDNIITLNTLEHIFDDRVAIAELFRVLRPGGRFHIGVPFLYRVHGSPSDYHRHTADAWARILRQAGAADDVVAEPIIWDRLSSAFSFIEFTRMRRILKPLVMLFAVVVGLKHGKTNGLPSRRADLDYALGYYFTGTKA